RRAIHRQRDRRREAAIQSRARSRAGQRHLCREQGPSPGRRRRSAVRGLMVTRLHTIIEPLEARVAPATIINPYTVTFQDTNGDTALVHISAPLFKSAKAAENILLFTTNDGSTESFTGNNVGESLSEINLLGNHAAQGMDITVKE